MNWTELLTKEIEDTYGATVGLVKMVDDKNLGWKPKTGENLTTGQLLEHITTACGMCCRGFVTGEWPMPADAKPEDMLPTADKMPAAQSKAETLKKLEADKALAIGMIKEAGEKNLAGKATPAPWDPTPMPLGRRLLSMVNHLGQHKSQLFYYLKLQGKPVNTMNLYGM